MKIRIEFSVDVDPEAWATEYGVAPDEVREHVRDWAWNALLTQIDVLGLGVGETR